MGCWSDNIKLVYDPKTGKSSNTPGVETRVPGWGVTATVEYLDPSWAARTIGVARYAAPFVERKCNLTFISKFTEPHLNLL